MVRSAREERIKTLARLPLGDKTQFRMFHLTPDGVISYFPVNKVAPDVHKPSVNLFQPQGFVCAAEIAAWI